MNAMILTLGLACGPPDETPPAAAPAEQGDKTHKPPRVFVRGVLTPPGDPVEAAKERLAAEQADQVRGLASVVLVLAAAIVLARVLWGCVRPMLGEQS